MGIYEAINNLSKRTGKSTRQLYRVFVEGKKIDAYSKALSYSEITGREVPPEAFLKSFILSNLQKEEEGVST